MHSDRCPLIPKDGSYATFGDVWNRLDELTDMYTKCRKDHDALIDFMNGRK